MPETAERVPENSPTYREFSRLYDLARQLRPTGIDRWNRELYATSGHGGFDHQTGAIGIHDRILREGLTRDPAAEPEWQSRALAKVLDRATQAGMAVQAPGEANAVLTTQSRGLNDGVAAVRAAADLHVLSRIAGYPPASFDDVQESGAYAATDELIQQTSGPSVDRHELLDRLHHGPAAMHFDQLAEAVVRNRLAEVAPSEGPDRQAMRRELIGTMLHPQWESLAQQSPESGRRVADQIGSALNAKVDEIKRGSFQAQLSSASESSERATTTKAPAQEDSTARFLTGLAPAGGAVDRRPQVGQGSRRPVPSHSQSAGRSYD